MLERLLTKTSEPLIVDDRMMMLIRRSSEKKRIFISEITPSVTISGSDNEYDQTTIQAF
jgi:hypothetical protein